VAGFIGSPTMNFLEADLVEREGVLAARGEGFDLKLPDELKARLGGASSGSVIVGIRPSCFKLETDTAQESSTIRLSIKVSEYLGAQSVLLTHCGKQDVLVEMESSSRIERGTTMTFSVAPEDIMVFDKRTEIRL
jgi:multiple sugar transport system ATP-binding protein